MKQLSECTIPPKGGYAVVVKPGGYIEFRAEMDCLVSMSNCPEDTLSACNAYTSTATKVEVFAAD